MLGHVAVQCTTKRSIVLAEARQSERSQDNTCHLCDCTQQFRPKVTLAGASTFLETLVMDNRPIVPCFLFFVLDIIARIFANSFFHFIGSFN